MADQMPDDDLHQERLMKFAQILYKCTLCTTLPSILTSRDTFLNHMKELHTSTAPGNVSTCHVCKISFGTKEDLETHHILTHRDNNQSEVSNILPQSSHGQRLHSHENGRDDFENTVLKDEQGIYHCPYCDWVSSLEVIMRAHLRRYHDNDEESLLSKSEEKKSPSFSKNLNDSHISIIIAHNEEWFHCKLCNIRARKDSLQAHCSSDQHQSRVFNGHGNFMVPDDDINSNNEIQNLQEEFGEFTCTMNLDNMTFYYCQLCCFKTKLVLTFRNHCKSVDHKLKIQSLRGSDISYSTNQNSDAYHGDMGSEAKTAPPSGGCSRRKRSFPVASWQRPFASSSTANESHFEHSDNESDHVDVKRHRKDDNLNNSETDLGENESRSNHIDNSVSNLQDIIRRIPFQSLSNPSKQVFPKSPGLIPPMNTMTDDPFQKLASRWDLEPKNSGSSTYNCEQSSKQSTMSNGTNTDQQNNDPDNKTHKDSDEPEVPTKMPQTKSPDQESRSGLLSLDYSMEAISKFLQELEQGVAKCPHCQQVLCDYDDYCSHVNEVHGFPDANSPKETVQESYKMRRIRQELEGVICECRMGVVGRDELLQTISVKCGIESSELMTWGPACNKAVRDLYPDSVAQRKGKYKKTYFFGVKFMITPMIIKTEAEDEGLTGLSPLRDISKDTEEILKYLHRIMTWTGRHPDFVTRDIVLEILATLISDPDVPNWGIQCNRAIRQTFPHVAIKRKWKFKTTCYYGLQLKGSYKEEYCHFKSKSYPSSMPPNVHSAGGGPPVVNVLDMSPSVSMQSPAMMDRRLISSPNMYSILEAAEKFGLEPSFSEDPALQNATKMLLDKTRDAVNTMEDPFHYSVRDESPGLMTGDSDQAKDIKKEVDSDDDTTIAPTSGQFPLFGAEGMEKQVLLHPGPFIMARILNRRYQHRVPYVDVVLRVMNTLQDMGLGWVCTHRPGNSKVFYKVLPNEGILDKLARFGVSNEEYIKMFSERDPKLETHMHERVKQQYPQLNGLAQFYSH